MKGKLLVGFTVAIMSFVNMAHADFIFYSNTDSCSAVSGSWTGNGDAYNWLIGKCFYHGSGSVSSFDEKGNFTFDINAYKDSGHYLCPEQYIAKATGLCVNGVVKITTEYGQLSGAFSQESGNAKGKLSVTGSSVDVNIVFKRTH